MLGWNACEPGSTLEDAPVRPVVWGVARSRWIVWELPVKKGRHRRFEEARSLKRSVEVVVEPCPECGAAPDEDHASWCLYESEEVDEEEDTGRA